MTGITFHLVAGEYFRDCDRAAPYRPESYEADGFIHCTDGPNNVAEVANRYYREDQRMYLALVIDKALLEPEIRYEDAEGIYPHLYGPLNRDAIVEVVPMLRGADGAFQPPSLASR